VAYNTTEYKAKRGMQIQVQYFKCNLAYMMHKFSIRCPHIQNHYTLTWNMLLSFTLKY